MANSAPGNSDLGNPDPLSLQVPGLEVLGLEVLGMTCAACQHHVEAALKATSGVQSARVDLMRHRATVKFDPDLTGAEILVKAVRDSGYDAVPMRGTRAGDGNNGQRLEGAQGWKAAITIFAGAAAMLLSMPIGMQPDAMSSADGLLMMLVPWLYELPESPLRWFLLVLTAVLAVWAGGSIYRSAWKALRHGETNMNTLISLGTSVAFVYSAYGTVWATIDKTDMQASGPTYFDSVLLILGFLLLGKWLESRARHRALSAVDALAELQPSTVRVQRKNGGNLEEVIVPVDEVQVGDRVVILPGERVPVDGVIESGRTTVDESLLTGESVPVGRGVGERVLAGSVNFDGAVVARVESAGEGTTLRQIARLVEQAQGSRAPMERLADRASAIFVPAVLGLALVTLIGWLFAGTVAEAIAATVSVLVIACPCAMGLAVPAALTVAIGRGANYGVLIKGGEALERLAGLQAAAMDKTGTLTLGHPFLVGIKVFGSVEEQELLRMAAAVEERSAHPLARAIVGAAVERGLAWEPAGDLQVIPGRGLSATLDGRSVLMGNAELMQEWSVPLPNFEPPRAGVTRLWMAIDGPAALQSTGYHIAGCFDTQDVVRPSGKAAVEWLQKNGLTVEMLTGDSELAAAPIAKAAGIAKVSAGLLPGDKVERIRALQAKGVRVAMVGDGINDAAALAQADAGMAMGSGAVLAQEAGDVLLISSDPAGVCTAIALARSTVRVMRQNLGWAIGYNLIGIPLAAGLLQPIWHVTLTPWMAAAAMALSSVSVLLNSLRLKNWKAPVLPVTGHA